MRVVRFFAALALCVIVQTVGLQITPAFTQVVDVFLVLVVVRALGSSPAQAMLYGLIAGWTADALAGLPFGTFGVADTLTAFAVATVAQRLVIERSLSRFGVFGAAALLQIATLALLARVFVAAGDIPGILWIIVKALTTGLLATVAMGVGASARRRWSRARRNRGSRLRFG
jgi:rod shape-determining protein MreD